MNMANAAITIDLNAKIANFETELKRATGSLDRFEKKGNQVAAGFKTAFGALGAAVSVGAIGAIAAFAKSGIDAADALNDMSERLGVSVKDLASFKLAAQLADTSLEGVGKGIARLSRSIGDAEGGNKKLAETLQTLGISARDPKEAFFQLADATKRIQDPATRAALLNQVLGKSYQELVPLLQQGGDALRKSAAESESFADAMARLAPEAGKFNDQLDRLRDKAAGVSGNVLNHILPAFNEWTGAADTLINRYGVLLGLLSAIGAAALPGVTAGKLSGSVSSQAFSDELKKAKDELSVIQSAQKSRTFGVIQLALYGSREGMERQRTYLESHISTLESSLAQFRQRQAAANKGGGAAGDTAAQIACIVDGGTWDGKRCINKPASGGAKFDPLTGLLGQTDIGKLAAFDKQVALLNARFDGGRKSTELYNQAMTRLVETTFSANFTDFNKQLGDQDETQRLVAEHLKATNDELFEQQQAWIEAGNALEEEMRTPLENANIEFGRLQDLLDRGVIRWETYGRAVMKVQDAIEETPEKLETMDSFAKTFAENAQNSFADFFKNFDQGTDGMLQKFGETIKGMIAEAVAADLAKYLFGGLVNGGSGSGAVGTVLTGIGKIFGFADGGIAAYGRPVALPRFAGGGIANNAAIFGEAGPEAAVPLPDGRRIPVEMRGGGNNYIVHVHGTNNAQEVRRAAGQGMREAVGLMERAGRYV